LCWLFSGLANSNVAISSATPACVLIVVFFAVGFTGMTNQMADMDSKASGAKFWWHFIFDMKMN